MSPVIRCWSDFLIVLFLLGSIALHWSPVTTLSLSGCGSPMTGLPADSVKRVVGGRPITTASFPWMVMFRKYGVSDVVCGGAILSHRLVLTAAHCFDDMNKNEMYMFTGKDELDYYTAHQRLYHASDVIIHDSYNITTKENDIAIVKTSMNIAYNSNVNAVCFPDASYQPPRDNMCIFAGYGDTKGTGFERRLNFMRVPLLNDSLCAQSDWLGNEFDAVRRVSLCAGYADGGPDSCTGDSGGALVCKNLHNQKYYMHGISSWGKGCGERHKPGVYTRIVSFIDWVTAQADRLSDD